MEAIIGEAKVCRIAMCDKGMPYVAPMSFGYESNCLYLHSTAQGKKIEILKRNPKVCFEVDLAGELVKAEIPCQWSLKYRSIIGFGRAVFIEEGEERRRALHAIARHYGGASDDYPVETPDKLAVIRVEIESMTGKRSG